MIRRSTTKRCSIHSLSNPCPIDSQKVFHIHSLEIWRNRLREQAQGTRNRLREQVQGTRNRLREHGTGSGNMEQAHGTDSKLSRSKKKKRKLVHEWLYIVIIYIMVKVVNTNICARSLNSPPPPHPLSPFSPLMSLQVCTHTRTHTGPHVANICTWISYKSFIVDI